MCCSLWFKNIYFTFSAPKVHIYFACNPPSKKNLTFSDKICGNANSWIRPLLKTLHCPELLQRMCVSPSVRESTRRFGAAITEIYRAPVKSNARSSCLRDTFWHARHPVCFKLEVYGLNCTLRCSGFDALSSGKSTEPAGINILSLYRRSADRFI